MREKEKWKRFKKLRISEGHILLTYISSYMYIYIKFSFDTYI